MYQGRYRAYNVLKCPELS